MAPPSKRMRQLCQLRQAAKQKRAVERASVELLEEPQLVAIDDDFDLDVIALDPDIVEQRMSGLDQMESRSRTYNESCLHWRQ